MTQQRAIILTHPMFDQPGKAGIMAASEYAKILIKHFQESVADIERNGAPSEAVEQMAEEVNQFGIKVRTIPGDI